MKKETSASEPSRVKKEGPAGRGIKREREQDPCATCAICEAPLGEDVEDGVRQASEDATGAEVIDACLNCVSTLSEGWPGWTWATGRDQRPWLHVVWALASA